MDSVAERLTRSSEPASAASSMTNGRLLMLLRLGVLLGCFLAIYVVAANWDSWIGAATAQTTDDAYLAADLTPMGARVQGLVQVVPVQDFQRVRKGDLLVQIRDDDYRAQVKIAEAELDAAQAQLSNVLANRPLQQANVAAASNSVVMADATLARDDAEDRRQRKLLATGIVGTQQLVERAEAAARSSKANLMRAQAQLQAALGQLEVINAQERQARAGIEGKQAQLDLGRINLSYTRIVASTDGEVGERLVRPGQYVGIGTQVIAVVSLPNVWALAHFKETQLTRVVQGMPATVTIDAFPGATLRGHVDSLSPGSGSQFALLPPDNATGNFTKVVQRITVKIVLDDAGELRDRLRPGMSIVASIRTRP